MKKSSLILTAAFSVFLFTAKAGAITPPADCQVPTSPMKVVIGFAGWLSYDTSYGLINGMLGDSENDPDIYFYYNAWDSVVANQMTDTLQCALALATTPYKVDGKAVYSTIVILGHSFGGSAAYVLAANLKKHGVTANLAVTADPRDDNNDPTYAPLWSKPANVTTWLNFYETNDWFFPGFPVKGAKNTQIGGVHLTAPTDPALTSATSKAVEKLPVSRPSFGP